MKKLFIVGAGGFGREIFSWASDHPDCGKEWEIAGFLDDNPRALDNYNLPVSDIMPFAGHQPEKLAYYVCAIGSPGVKRQVCESLESRGAQFISLVHPSVALGRGVILGRGVVLCPHVTLTCDINLGDFVMFNCYSSAGHDVVVGDWSTISGHCDLTGHCHLERAVFLGSGARVIPGKRIGAEAYIGAGSVVIQSIPPKAKVFGNPAQKV